MEDTLSRLIAAVKEDPEYTYDEYAEALGVGGATALNKSSVFSGWRKLFVWIFAKTGKLFVWIFAFLSKLFVWIISISYFCREKPNTSVVCIVKDLSTDIYWSGHQEILTSHCCLEGPMAELVVGLELLHHMSPNIRHDLYYWVRHAKNSQAEVDYISNYLQVVVPIEVKADTQGGMKSLWAFMRDKKLHYAIRCSMENFGKFDYVDNEDNAEVRHVHICPMYAVSQIEEVKQGIEK